MMHFSFLVIASIALLLLSQVQVSEAKTDNLVTNLESPDSEKGTSFWTLKVKTFYDLFLEYIFPSYLDETPQSATESVDAESLHQIVTDTKEVDSSSSSVTELGNQNYRPVPSDAPVLQHNKLSAKPKPGPPTIGSIPFSYLQPEEEEEKKEEEDNEEETNQQKQINREELGRSSKKHQHQHNHERENDQDTVIQHNQVQSVPTAAFVSFHPHPPHPPRPPHKHHPYHHHRSFYPFSPPVVDFPTAPAVDGDITGRLSNRPVKASETNRPHTSPVREPEPPTHAAVSKPPAGHAKHPPAHAKPPPAHAKPSAKPFSVSSNKPAV